MENDNTIFQNPNQGSLGNNTQGPVNFPPAQGISQVYSQSSSKGQQMVEVNQGGELNDSKKGRSGGIKKLFNIFLGIFMLLGILMIIIVFLIPSLNRNSISGEVTLNYWGLFEENSVMQSIISDFEKENPGIKVNYVKQDISQYREKLATRISNGTGPDIFRYHNTWYPMLKDYLLPLPSQTISKDAFMSIYYPVMQQDLIKNGAIYGIPLQVDTLALFINTQLFQTAGLTPPVSWNDFINDARAITVRDASGNIKTAGAAMGTYGNVNHAADIISLLFLENSVDINNFSQYEDRIRDAITFYLSFANDRNSVWDATLDPSQLAFAKGNLGMFFGYSADYFAIKQFNPNLAFQIVPVPQLPNQNSTLASYWVEGTSVKGKHQKESLLFMKFLTKKETEQKLYNQASKIRDFGQPFARIDLADSLKTNPLVYPFVTQAITAKSSPFVDGTFDNGLNQKLNSSLEKIINKSINTEAFVTEVSPILQYYWK